MTPEQVLFLVPARGGSKGLRRKNARALGDAPLLEWTQRAVAAACDGARCLLSTDDDEIAEIGRAAGFDVPFLRPAELGTDTASVADVAVHAVEWLRANRGSDPQAVMLLQPTSPFRPAELLVRALEMLDDDTDAVLGLKALNRTPATLFHMAGEGQLSRLDESAELITRRQEVEPLYTTNGSLYLVRTSALERDRTFFPARAKGVLTDQITSIDIDDAVDWELAEAVAASGRYS